MKTLLYILWSVLVITFICVGFYAALYVIHVVFVLLSNGLGVIFG